MVSAPELFNRGNNYAEMPPRLEVVENKNTSIESCFDTSNSFTNTERSEMCDRNLKLECVLFSQAAFHNKQVNTNRSSICVGRKWLNRQV